MSDNTTKDADVAAKHVQVAVIGAGPAGMTAALYASRAGLTTALFEQLSPGGQMAKTTKIDNYPGFAEGVDAFDLVQAMSAQAVRFGAVQVGEQVVRADLKAAPKRLTGAMGSVYTADAVIIATGAHPRPLGVDGEQELRGRGVSYCATCDGGFFRGKDVVVVGGGNTAAGDALYLANLCPNVHLVHRRDRLRAESTLIDALAEHDNIHLHLNSQVESLHTEGGRLSGVEVRGVDGAAEVLPASGLFVAVGVQPSSELARDAGIGLDDAGYIAAGEDCSTDIPGVFAAGDVRTKPLRQVVTAVSDGAVAAEAAFNFLSNL